MYKVNIEPTRAVAGRKRKGRTEPQSKFGKYIYLDSRFVTRPSAICLPTINNMHKILSRALVCCFFQKLAAFIKDTYSTSTLTLFSVPLAASPRHATVKYALSGLYRVGTVFLGGARLDSPSKSDTPLLLLVHVATRLGNGRVGSYVVRQPRTPKIARHF